MGERRVAGLDGLRGVAIGLVLVGHATGWVSLGAAGVALFFALSGYLITGLLRREQVATGRVDLRAFWARRARRLVPALVPVVALFGVLLVASGGTVRDAVTVLLPPATFTQNLYAAFAGSQKGPLYHTWSLGIEEQFYLLWPLAVVAVRSRRALLWGTCTVAAMSLAVRLVSPHQYAHDAPWTCACLLAAGCIVALTGWRTTRAQVTAALVGIVVLCAATEPLGLFTVEKWVPPAAAVLGAVAVAGAAGHPALSGDVLRWLGTRSYSIYLWHYPLMLLVDGVAARIVAGAVALLLGEASHRFVEQPFLRLRQRPVLEVAERAVRRVRVEREVAPAADSRGR